VDRLTLHRLRMMQTAWVQFPPLHVLVRGFVGYEAPDERPHDVPLEPAKDRAELPEYIRSAVKKPHA